MVSGVDEALGVVNDLHRRAAVHGQLDTVLGGNGVLQNFLRAVGVDEHRHRTGGHVGNRNFHLGLARALGKLDAHRGGGAAVPGGLDLHGNLDRLAVLLHVLNSLAADLGRRLGLAVFVGFHRAGGAVSGLVLGDGTAVLLRLGLGHGAVLADGGLGHGAISPGLSLGGGAVGIVLRLRLDDRIAVGAVPVGGRAAGITARRPAGLRGRSAADHGDRAGGGFARTVRRGGGDRRGTCLDRRHGAVRGYRGNILVRGRPSQSLVGGVLRRDRGGQRFAVSNRNRSFRLVQRNLGYRDDLGRDGALVAADITGRIRVIGVDVSGFVLDAFFSIRAVSVRTFVPVVRTVLAPIAVAVLVRGRRHGERRGLGVYGRRAHAVAARMVVRVPEHTAEQLAALCRRDGRDRVAGNVVPSVARTFAAGTFDVRPVLAAVGAALPLILQRVEILLDQLGGECHRITHSRGHALRLLRDHGCDAHKEPP